MPSSEAFLAPDVLVWARESAGLAPEDAARRIGITEDRLRRAETGEDPLTLNQARKAADVYKRPFAVLFLPEPPIEDPIEVQFRRLRDAPSLPWPAEMRALARRVPVIQDEADALFEAIDEEPRWYSLAGAFDSLSEAAQLGEQVRAVLGIPLEYQKAAARSDPAGFKVFRLWREAIEDLGILVLQDGSLPLDDMRGFAAPHGRVPAIVINTNDDVRARLFTMLHELAHIFSAETEEARFEEFAGTTLMPAPALAMDFKLAPPGTLVNRIDAVARMYGTTPDATAVRLGWANVVSWPEILEVRAEIRERGGQGSRATGGNFYRNVVARYGPGFVSRVLDGVGASAISELTAARLLGVRVERLDLLRKELGSDAG